MLSFSDPDGSNDAQNDCSDQSQPIDRENQKRSLLKKLGLKIPDFVELTQRNHDTILLFEELQKRAENMRLPDALIIINKLQENISRTSARRPQSDEDRICILIRLGLVMCTTRSLEAAIQLASLADNTFHLDQPCYEDYACIAMDGVAKSIGQRYTTLLLHRELQKREIQGKGKTNKTQVITELAEEVVSKRPSLTQQKVKGLLRNCDNRSKMWKHLSSNFDGDEILCLIVTKGKGMTTSQMQEIPNAFANAFAHVAHELLHDDLEPILNALKKDRPATLKNVAMNLGYFGTGTTRRSGPLLRRDWEELLGQNNKECTPPAMPYGDTSLNTRTCPDSGFFPPIQQIQSQQYQQQHQPMSFQQAHEPVLFENSVNCFDEWQNLCGEAFADYSGTYTGELAALNQRGYLDTTQTEVQHQGSCFALEQPGEDRTHVGNHADEQYNYQQNHEGMAHHEKQYFSMPLHPAEDANSHAFLEGSGDFSNYNPFFDECDLSFFANIS